MSNMMLKMAADMMGVKPEELIATISSFQTMAQQGIHELEQINSRLTAIEGALNLAPSDERQNDGEEIGITETA